MITNAARAMRAIRSLKPGESFTEVMFDRQAEGFRPSGGYSLRAVVTLHFAAFYSATLEEYNETLERWGDYDEGRPKNEISLLLGDVPAVLAYYRVLAELDRRRAEADAEPIDEAGESAEAGK